MLFFYKLVIVLTFGKELVMSDSVRKSFEERRPGCFKGIETGSAAVI